MIYLILFYEFFKIGLFSFGGGLAMLPLMQNVVFQNNWLTEQQFLDIIAISQITPGPIAINTATFVGHQVAGVPGAFVATFSSALPSFIVILIVANIFDKIKDNPRKAFFFKGVKPVTLALITYAGVIIAKPTFFVSHHIDGLKAGLIFILVFLGMKYITKVNPIIILIAASTLSLILF